MAEITERVSAYFKACDDAGVQAKALEVEIAIGSGRMISANQRKYYFKCLVNPILDFYRGNFRALVLDIMEAVGMELSKDFIHELLKMMFNNGKSTMGNSTAKAERRFMAIREYYARKHGLQLKEPNE